MVAAFQRLVLVAAVVASWPCDDASTAACLEGGDACGATCATPPSFTRRCLDSFVPFRTPYARVACCLRPCFAHHVKAYGLDANWRRFRATEGAAPGGMLDLLVAHDGESTLPFAPRRLSKVRNAWLNDRDPKLRQAQSSLGPELRLDCRGDGCRAADRRDTEQRLWSVDRTGTPATKTGAPVLAAGDVGDLGGWVEAHFPDGCGSHSRSQPFAAYREITLASLFHAAAGDAELTLVTSTDCDLPHAPQKPLARDGFKGERSLLETAALRAWYTTNPSDHGGAAHAKLRAVPIGVANRAALLGSLDGREGLDRRARGLACCASPPRPLLSFGAHPVSV